MKVLIAIAILSIGLASFLSAAGQIPPETLKTGEVTRKQIGGGETQNFDIALTANQFLSLTVDQHATDVAVKLVAPDGKTAAEADLSLGGSVIERIWYIAPAAGVYKLQIISAEKPGTTGNYDLKIAELRAADEKAAKLVRAAALSAEAFVLQEQRTAAGFAGAIEKYKEAAQLAQEAGDRTAELMPRVWLGVFYVYVRQPQLALEENETARKITREIGDRATEAQILDNFGRLYFGSDPAKSLDYFTQALNLRTEIGARRETTTSLYGIGSIYSQTGAYEKAVEIFNRILAIYRETGDAKGEATALAGLGTLYASFGEHQKAIDAFQKALDYFHRTKISFTEVVLLTNIGGSYEVLGELQKAIEFYNEALTVARAVGNRQIEVQALILIGSIYEKLGDSETGLGYITDALNIAREMKLTTEIIINLNNLGHIYYNLHEPEKAVAYLTEALQLARQTNEKIIESVSLFNLAYIFVQQGKYQEALTYYQQALEIHRALGNSTLLVTSLTGIGNIYFALGDETKATESLNEALALVRTNAAPRREAETLSVLAKFQNKNGKLDEARKNIAAAIKLSESIRSRVASQDLRTLYFAEVSDYYDLQTEILENLDRARPNENFDRLALESAENAKARSLLDLLNESHADIRQGVDPALLEREQTARQTLSAKANRQAQILAAKDSTSEQKAAIQAEVNRLTGEYETIQAEIRQASPRYAALTQPAPVSVADIQKQVLDRDTILLEYSLGEEESYLWVVGQNSLKSYVLPGRAEIEKSARRVYELLTARNHLPETADAAKNQRPLEQAVAELSRMILTPAGDLGGKRLLIVADGALQYIPFGVLAAKTGKKSAPLVASDEIVNLPSAATIIALRREEIKKDITNSITIVADPVFEATDSRVANQTANKPDGKLDQKNETARRAAGESGLNGFSRLRFSRDEADNIAAIATRLKPLEILDFAANKETLATAQFGKSGIVHFATHGLINSRNPELSGIVLSLVNEKGEPKDGFLRLFEIYNLQLDADLVVLSACQTALGQEIKGEGLVGLTRGFMYAGAPRVVASLWSVDDRATAELMRRFYQKLLRDKMRPAAALRAAQIEMRQNPRFSDPYYWAAFTLQGEWK